MNMIESKFSFITLAKLFVLFACTLVLISCNGGGTPPPPGSTDGSTSLSLSVSQTSVKTDNSDSATVTATILKNNTPMAGVTVRFAATAGQINTTSLITDANGTASVTFTSGTVSKANREATITASASGYNTASIPVKISGTYISAETSKSQLEVGNSGTLTITVKDGGDIGVYNADVTIAQISGNGSMNLSAATGKTDATGALSITYTAVSDGSVVLQVSALGAQTQSTIAIGSTDNDVPEPEKPGEASTIILSSTSPTPAIVGIAGGGVQESISINFLVVDINNEPATEFYLVDFSILNGGLNGGEALNNIQDTTDSNAIATTVFNAGTKAGTVQIRASLTNDPTIFADISVTITGGLPSGNALGLSATPLNIQGRKTWGLTQDIRVSVADYYSNPVAPNAQVQMQSDFAETTGTALFVPDSGGHSSSANVQLTTGPPNPIDGFVEVVGQTIGGSYSKVLSLAVDPNNSNIIYAGSDGGGIFKSSDGGTNWNNIGSPLKEIGAAKFKNLTGTLVRDIIIDSNNSSVVYAATDKGVFVTTNSGEAWHTLTGLRRIEGDYLGLTTGSYYTLFMTYPEYYDGYGEIFEFSYAHSGSRSRTKIYVNGSEVDNYLISGNMIQFVSANSPLASGYVISADYDTSSSLPNKPVYALAIDPTPTDFDVALGHAKTIYAGIYGDGVWKTSNGGKSWKKISTMAPGQGVTFGRNVLTMEINSLSPSELFAGTDGEGLFHSIDSGLTWTKMTGTISNSINETEVRDITIAPLSGKVNDIWIAGKNGIHYSNDGGASWRTPSINVQNSDPNNTDVRAIVRDPVDATLYAATFGNVLDRSSPHGGIFSSTDGGETWSKTSDISSVTGAHTIEALAIAGQSGNDLLIAGTEGRSVYISNDSGQNWNKKNGTNSASITNTLFTTIRLLHSGPMSGIGFEQLLCGYYQGAGVCGEIWAGESAQFYVDISDDLGHTLTSGTSYAATASPGILTGTISETLPDATYGNTDYYHTWYNEPTLTEDTVGEFTINVNGSNGTSSLKVGLLLRAKLQGRSGEDAVPSLALSISATGNSTSTSLNGYGGSGGPYEYGSSSSRGSIDSNGNYSYSNNGLIAGDTDTDTISIYDLNMCYGDVNTCGGVLHSCSSYLETCRSIQIPVEISKEAL
ncbi:MAG: Ig-like domain-containing protein [Proteobacteria bacterium]|nr:Ig-like domain-containing protein [Pseudomonadota bacterium]MBU1687551.1 Ig-like domain-containing protein [Pseudomonadota bacterium]